MGSFPITSRRERSTGLLNPSVFHTHPFWMCIAGTSQQALSTTTGVAFAVGKLGSAMQLHHDARGNRALP